MKGVDITSEAEGGYRVLVLTGVLPSLAGGEGVRGRDGSWERQSVNV